MNRDVIFEEFDNKSKEIFDLEKCLKFPLLMFYDEASESFGATFLQEFGTEKFQKDKPKNMFLMGKTIKNKIKGATVFGFVTEANMYAAKVSDIKDKKIDPEDMDSVRKNCDKKDIFMVEALTMDNFQKVRIYDVNVSDSGNEIGGISNVGYEGSNLKNDEGWKYLDPRNKTLLKYLVAGYKED